MIKKVLKRLLWLYKAAISPVLPPSCRFYPTCSDYAGQAIESHGALRGVFLAFKRLLRCHPFYPGGFDPVPEATTMHMKKHQVRL